jgi:hypothetical protein
VNWERTRNLGILLLVGSVITVAVLTIRRDHLRHALDAQRETERERAEKLAEQHRIDLLASQWNAVTKWQEEFSGQDSFLFTAAITRVLVRPDGRPLLFNDADAEDVVERAGQFTCYFGVALNRSGGLLPLLNTTARLALSCDSAKAEELMRRGEGESYALVARISGVQSYENVNTEPDSGEAFRERRFLVYGTELGQEHEGTDERKGLHEFLKSLSHLPQEPTD